jgi:EAL domain-containing protein (putative c-di-GMP-specific phosphodiesterase class I)
MLIDLGVDYLQGYYFGQPYNYRKWRSEDEVA